MLILLLSISWLAAPLQATTETPDTSSVGQDSSTVALIKVSGAISPVTVNYIKRGIEQAKSMQAEALIIQLDTPGGLLKSTKTIVQAFLDSEELPIVVYVAPEGAWAASAGTFITMAAHIAAMAPATNIGSASPVQMGAGGGTASMDTVMQKKLFNYSASYIKAIAEQRERNAEWAVQAVRDAEAITAEQALQKNVIDLIAQSQSDLLQKLDGRKAAGKILQTQQATIEPIPTNMAEQFFGFIMLPQVMLILTMIAIYGIVGEVMNPGAVFPGMIGVMALVLLLYASAAMPINVAGYVFIVLAIILFVAEAFTPAFGLLIAGGAVSFFLGVLMLFQELPKSMELSWAWLIPATLLTAAFFLWIAVAGIKNQFTPVHTGLEAMVGQQATVTDRVDTKGGRIFVQGEFWNATSDTIIEEGQPCEIIEIKGLKMKVKSLT